MLFQRPLSFFVTAMYLASSVTASAILGRTCPIGTLRCCDSNQAFSSLSQLDRNAFIAADPNVKFNVPVGVGCTLAAGTTCTKQLLCCNGVVLTTTASGLSNVADNCASA
ncbi:hypothetical protein EI94DRAFT_1730954 [Lactarius quietus]|nr:hypothetical protein EI94DRAFT_1730954 [Lactarius quietus]